MQLPLKRSGTSILEISIAVAILAFAISAIYVVHINMMKQLNATNCNVAVAQNIGKRMDQIRGAYWTNVTDPAYLSGPNFLGTVLADTTDNVSTLVSEQLVVSPVRPQYMSPTPSPSPTSAATPPDLYITRTGTGTPVVSPSPYSGDLVDEYAVKLTLTTTWKDASSNAASNTHTRKVSTIVSRTGMRSN
jgi:hypothetical protein